MARRRVLVGFSAVLIAVVAAVAVNELRSGSSDGGVTAKAASGAFASRGIVLVRDANAGLVPGSTEHLRGVLWNPAGSAREGMITVVLLASEAEARRLAAHHMTATSRDPCGGTVASDFHTWQARNVVTTLSTCDFIDGGTKPATNPATATINLAMHDLAALSGETRAGR